ncbi:putative calmodulin-binding protein [Tieghemostelium lacteum]|uniref:Putative calmodulin-binding protein n=1 Tax=Tieghemostelium lacteum TaxID=361077 RepID=A0A151Z5C9_TIELA|nr:putative calmodulin-binding protein [Tieghemostelium lacteum]|eukprot:KYQ89117.1 putative calmodulin-binding protein [Tieghemostelium lacteum]
MNIFRSINKTTINDSYSRLTVHEKFQRLPRSFQYLEIFDQTEYIYFKEMIGEASFYIKKLNITHPPKSLNFIEFNGLFTNITSLVLGSGYYNSKNPGIFEIADFKLPRTVRSLNLGYGFQLKLKIGTLPETLTELSIHYSFEYEGFQWVGDLCEPLQSFAIGAPRLQDPIPKGLFPSSLKRIRILMDNDILDDLPSGLEELYISSRRLSKLNSSGWLPNSLRIVILINFNEPFQSGTFPDSLEKLVLDKFNQPILPNTLPKNLKVLEIPTYEHDIISEGILPDTIEHLKIPKVYIKNVKRSLPSSLLHLVLTEYDTAVPIEPDIIPVSLKTITVSYPCVSNGSLLKCTNLKSLSLHYPVYSYPTDLTSNFPNQLTELTIPYLTYKSFKSGDLNSLTHLTVSIGIYQKKSVIFDFDSKYLPPAIELLDLGPYTNCQFLSNSTLPKSLRIFKVGHQYTNIFPKNLLPPFLVKLYLPLKQKETILKHCKIPFYCSFVQSKL